MVREATLMIETALPYPMTCDSAVGIAKGALLTLTDPMTVATGAADEADFGGIAAEEKIANDGKTKIAVYRRGWFKCYASGSVTAGDTLASASAIHTNELAVATATAVGGETAGIALESASDAQSFMFELMPGANNQAY